MRAPLRRESGLGWAKPGDDRSCPSLRKEAGPLGKSCSTSTKHSVRTGTSNLAFKVYSTLSLFFLPIFATSHSHTEILFAAATAKQRTQGRLPWEAVILDARLLPSSRLDITSSSRPSEIRLIITLGYHQCPTRDFKRSLFKHQTCQAQCIQHNYTGITGRAIKRRSRVGEWMAHTLLLAARPEAGLRSLHVTIVNRLSHDSKLKLLCSKPSRPWSREERRWRTTLSSKAAEWSVGPGTSPAIDAAHIAAGTRQTITELPS